MKKIDKRKLLFSFVNALFIIFLFSCSQVTENPSLSFTITRDAIRNAVGDSQDTNTYKIECELKTSNGKNQKIEKEVAPGEKEAEITFEDLEMNSTVSVSIILFKMENNIPYRIQLGESEKITISESENRIIINLKKINDTLFLYNLSDIQFEVKLIGEEEEILNPNVFEDVEYFKMERNLCLYVKCLTPEILDYVYIEFLFNDTEYFCLDEYTNDFSVELGSLDCVREYLNTLVISLNTTSIFSYDTTTIYYNFNLINEYS